MDSIVLSTETLFFLRRQEDTYLSSSRRVEGFSVSKSISISSGFEFLSEGSLDWIMCTTRPSLSPGSLLMSRLSCLFSSYVIGLHFSPVTDDPVAPGSSSRLGTGCKLAAFIISFLLGFFLGTISLLLLLLVLFFLDGCERGVASWISSTGMLPFLLCLSFFFSFFSFSFLFGLLACGWERAASCSWTAFNCSCNSANLWALSSSESSVEDSDSEDESLELSEDEATWARGG